MTIITRNYVAEHLKDRIDWQAAVLAYHSRNGRTPSEQVRQEAKDNRAEAYRMADLLGIDLNNYNLGR